MLIGIMSDSHGDHRMVRQALSIFDAHKVEHVIHCGDVCGAHVFEELAGRACTFVWGNMDDREPSLFAFLESISLSPPHEIPTRRRLGGKSFAIFHGHEPGFANAVKQLDVDYIVHGHTHVARDERRGHTRIINPGALYRAKRKTVALLDTTNDLLEYIDVEQPS